MNKVTANFLANITGKLWSLLSVVIFIRFYLDYLGYNNYTIISYATVLGGIVAFLDTGLTIILSRQCSRLDISINQKRKSFYTIETLFTILILVTGAFYFIFEDFLLSFFFNSVNSVLDIKFLFRLIILEVLFQLLFKFYIGGIIGCNRHKLSNLLLFLWSLIRNGFVILLISKFNSLSLFFGFQLIVTVFFCIASRINLAKLLQAKKYPIFLIKKTVISDNLKFLKSLLLISIVAIINTQFDKLIIAKQIGLNILGFYSIALSLTVLITSIPSPFATTFQPIFTSYFTSNNSEKAKKIFFELSYVVNFLIYILTAILIFWSKNILFLWSGDIKIVDGASMLLKILALGNAAIGMQVICYTIAIANGDLKLNTFIGIGSLIFALPAYYFCSLYLGIQGVALVFSTIQIILMIIYNFLIVKKYIKKTNPYLYLIKYNFFPFFIVFLIFGSLQFVINDNMSYVFIKFLILSLISIALIAGVIFNSLKKLKKTKIDFF